VRRSLQSVAIYFGLADEPAAERAQREQAAAKQSTASLAVEATTGGAVAVAVGLLVTDGILNAVIFGAAFGVFFFARDLRSRRRARRQYPAH
jgi:hypothetical protein